MAATDAVGTSASSLDWLNNSNYKPNSKTTTDNTTDALANKETFLQLLVAQIKNQDPMNPQDGVQFLSQLAQFSDLEQTIQMRQELTMIRTTLQSPSAQDQTTTDDTGKG
jgi:flagellar basal-body rod modification protein FlgD